MLYCDMTVICPLDVFITAPVQDPSLIAASVHEGPR